MTNAKDIIKTVYTDLWYLRLKLHITETIRLIENHWYALNIAVTDGNPALITTAMGKRENQLGVHILAISVCRIDIVHSRVSTAVIAMMMMTLTTDDIGNETENHVDLNVKIVRLLIVKRMALGITNLGI